MTELIWEGKYKDGKRVAPLRIALPFQTVETVNESGQVRAHQLALFQQGKATDWRNRLIWGDKKYVLPALLEEFAGKVNLIYIDPPFATGANFSFTTTIPESDEALEKEPSMIEQKAYRDMWGRGLDSYLQWFYETVVLLRDLLAEDGSIYVHLDWRMSSYARVVLDEIFGAECFQNEISWCYREAINSRKRWNRKHDTILFFTRHPDLFTFRADAVLEPHSKTTVAKYRYEDEHGKYRLMGRGIVGSPIQSARDISPDWERTHPELVYRHYLRDGTYAVDYWNIDVINQASKERLDYATQKPEALLDRIIRASSNEGDLVLDCFCARAGTAVVTPLNPPVNGGRPEQTLLDGGRPEGPLGDGRPGGTLLAGETPLAPSPLAGRAGVGSCPIEDIRPGDWVLAYDGRAHRVTRTHSRRYHGEMVGLRRADSETILWLTPDHRVLCPRRVRALGERGQWSAIAPNHFERARELRRELSPPERRLWSALAGSQVGVKFRRQHPIGPYIADFYAREAGLVVEVDGDAAHGSQEAMAYDHDRDEWMRSCGLRVLRFTARDVYANTDAVTAAIAHACQEHVLPDAPARQWRFAGDLAAGDTVYDGPDLRPRSIISIERITVDEEVYDLEVEDAHSYLTTVCAVHNCGSGTTAAVAEKLGRRWITADLGRFAIHTTRKRLLGIENVSPFVVQNLGKYERQQWQVAEFAQGDPRQAETAQLGYRQFILDLYHAQPISGYTWLHGVRDGRLVHVGAVDAPVAVGDVQQIVGEFWKTRGQASVNGVDILGWDFAFELHEVGEQMAAEAGVQVKFKRIPRETLEKKAVEQGDIRFFELAALDLRLSQSDREGVSGQERPGGRHVTITLTDFIMALEDVPDDVRAAVTRWSQWIDYWAVDWDFKGDTFHNMAQTYRTRKDPNNLQTSLAHTYDAPGVYTIVVKVIDLLGNDTTKALKVEVR